jgi:hypothetical protein
LVIAIRFSAAAIAYFVTVAFVFSSLAVPHDG